MNKQHVQELQVIKPNKDINQFVPLEQFYLKQVSFSIRLLGKKNQRLFVN